MALISNTIRSVHFATTGSAVAVIAHTMSATASYATQAGKVVNDTVATVSFAAAASAITERVQPTEYAAACSAVIVHATTMTATVSYGAECSADTFASDTDSDRYELFATTGDLPFDLSTPVETFTSLPHTTSATFTGPEKHLVVVRKRNKWDKTSLNLRKRVIYVRGNDTLIGYRAPSPPRELAIEQATGNEARITTVYDERWEVTGTVAATEALLYTTTDGTDPDPDNDTPIVLILAIPQPPQPLVFDFNHPDGPFGDGVEVRVLMRMRGGPVGQEIDSVSTPIVSVTIVTDGPAAPLKIATEPYQKGG